MLTSRCYKHGPNLWQEHHKAKDALRGARKNKRIYTSIWDMWQNDATYREAQLAIGWSAAWVRYLDHIAQMDISHAASHEQRGRYHNLMYLRSMDEDTQAPRLSTRPGYREVKTALVEMEKQLRQDLVIPFIQKKVKGIVWMINSILNC